MKPKTLRNLTLSAMFIAIGLLLPMLTGQIQQFGNMLLPMHIPVLLCGLICGWPYGLAVGFILPVLRSMLFGMPPMFPIATAMAFELAAYGFFAGLFYNASRWKCIYSLYRSMLAAMMLGRVVWGAVMTALMGVSGGAFSFQAFIAGALLNAIPGIILQLMLVPTVMIALDRTKLVPFSKKSKEKTVASGN